MCGICGIRSFDGRPVDIESLKLMNDRMVHRGPDDEGFFVNDTIGIAMRRLSIIDISGGHQPISNENKRYHVILNGEIYNYVELREELIARGHRFATNSDTEVIVHLFEDEGTGCVKKLNGMFAFAVWDDREKELYLFRDRIGIKPLFYTEDNNRFLFSSDLSALMAIIPSRKDISFDAFLIYFGLSYIPHPQTIYRNVHKLEPGYFLKVDAAGELIKSKYWDIEEFETLDLPRIEDYQELLLELLRDSIRLQMRSDVPIGTFLSGGIDSSCVVALLSEQVNQPVKTFSVGFEGNHTDELPYASMVSQKYQTDHTELVITSQDISDYFPQVVNSLDEPLSDNALFPTLMLSRIAREKGVKVILNGTGGDEIFAGYGRYRPRRMFWKSVNNLPLKARKLLGGIYRFIDQDHGFKMSRPELAFTAAISGINYSFARDLLGPETHFLKMLTNVQNIYDKFSPDGNHGNNVSSLMFQDFKNYLVGDVLALLDKMSMAVSLEGRVPLLDHRIAETCFRIPESTLLANGQLKGLFKKSLRGILPDEILDRPKAGFAGPVNYWINETLKKDMVQHLVEEPIPFYREHLNLDAIKQALSDSQGPGRSSESVFSLYMFDLWYRTHMK